MLETKKKMDKIKDEVRPVKVNPKTRRTMAEIKTAMQQMEALEVTRALVIKGDVDVMTRRNPRIHAEEFVKTNFPASIKGKITAHILKEIDDETGRLQNYIIGE